MSHDVFISYSREDWDKVNDLCKCLDKNDIDFWIDKGMDDRGKDNIKIKDFFFKNISNAIDDAKIFLLIISLNSNGSEIVENEYFRATKRNKIIMPIFIEKLDLKLLKSAFQYEIAGKACLDFYNNTSEDCKRLVRAIKRELIHNIYICYAEEDNDIAELLYKSFKKNPKFNCWMASKDLEQSGEDIKTQKTEVIKKSDITVLVYSKNTPLSEEATTEINLACIHNNVIIPFIFDKSELDDSIAHCMAKINGIIVDDNEKCCDSLVCHVEEVISKGTHVINNPGGPGNNNNLGGPGNNGSFVHNWDYRVLLFIPLLGSFMFFLYLREKTEELELLIFGFIYLGLQIFSLIQLLIGNIDNTFFNLYLLIFIGSWIISMFHGFILFRKLKKKVYHGKN